MPPDIQPGGASEDRKWTVIVAADVRDRLPRARRTDPALRCSTKRPDKRFIARELLGLKHAAPDTV